MANYQLNAELRSELGTATAKKIRRNRLVPANVYGHKKENVNISVTSRDIEKALASGEHLIDLSFGDETRVVVIKDLQNDPVRGTVQHVDFYEVSMDREIEMVTVVSLEGEAERESDGGIVNLILRELNISCLPSSIPDNLVVDVSGMVIGDSVTIADITIPEGVTVNHDLDEIIVTISVPAAEEEETEEVDELDGEEVEETEETSEEAE